MTDQPKLVEERVRETAHRLWEESGRPEGREQHFWFEAEAQIRGEEARLDSELNDSFPASDPPSSTVTTGSS